MISVALRLVDMESEFVHTLSFLRHGLIDLEATNSFTS